MMSLIASETLKVDLQHLSYEHRVKAKDLVEWYQPNRNISSPVEIKLILSDDVSVYQPPRRLPYSRQQIVGKQVSEWLEQKIIQPSTSDYAAPIVLVGKKMDKNDYVANIVN